MVVNVSPPQINPDTGQPPGTRGRASGTGAGPSRPGCRKGTRRPASANARGMATPALGPPSATRTTTSSQKLARGPLRRHGPSVRSRQPSSRTGVNPWAVWGGSRRPSVITGPTRAEAGVDPSRVPTRAEATAATRNDDTGFAIRQGRPRERWGQTGQVSFLPTPQGPWTLPGHAHMDQFRQLSSWSDSRRTVWDQRPDRYHHPIARRMGIQSSTGRQASR